MPPRRNEAGVRMTTLLIGQQCKRCSAQVVLDEDDGRTIPLCLTCGHRDYSNERRVRVSRRPKTIVSSATTQLLPYIKPTLNTPHLMLGFRKRKGSEAALLEPVAKCIYRTCDKLMTISDNTQSTRAQELALACPDRHSVLIVQPSKQSGFTYWRHSY